MLGTGCSNLAQITPGNVVTPWRQCSLFHHTSPGLLVLGMNADLNMSVCVCVCAWSFSNLPDTVWVTRGEVYHARAQALVRGFWWLLVPDACCARSAQLLIHLSLSLFFYFFLPLSLFYYPLTPLAWTPRPEWNKSVIRVDDRINFSSPMFHKKCISISYIQLALGNAGNGGSVMSPTPGDLWGMSLGVKG